MPLTFEILPAISVDPERLEAHLRAAWHDETVAARGELLRPAEHPGFVAIGTDHGEIVGHAAWRLEPDGDAYLVAIDALPSGAGVGSALLASVEAAALRAGCRRMQLDTTNDNVEALRFYQRRGYRIVAVRPGAVDEARRRLKPAIPEIGRSGIPMRDELSLEKRL